MDLNLLVAFEALHRERSVTRAGRILGLSQPATSAVLARLRAAVGDELFVRTPRGLEPTARADALAGPVARALEDLRAALDDECFDPTTATETFRLGAVDAVLSVLLGATCARVMREAPRAQLVARSIDPAHVSAMFEARDLDLALAPIPQVPAHVGSRDLFPIDLVLALRPGHPLTRSRAKTPTPTMKEIARFPHVVVSFAGPARTAVDEALAAAGMKRHVAVVLGSFLAVPFLLATSDAVAIIPGPMARALAAKGMLAYAPLPATIPQPRLTMRLLWPMRLDRSASHAWLRELVTDVARGVATVSP